MSNYPVMADEVDMPTAPPQESPSLSNLPEEVIRDILLRLPVKSLLKIRCVSKSWLLLISSYDFAKAHLKNSVKNDVYGDDRLIFGSEGFPMDLYTCSIQSAVDDSFSNCSIYPPLNHSNCSIYPPLNHSNCSIYPPLNQNLLVQGVCFDCPLYEPDDVIWLVGSCNGLVCVSLSIETLILWNPTTRKSKKLPNSGTVLDFEYYAITYGFGYDELHDDYKVVEFFSFERVAGAPALELQLKVYSLRANSWNSLSNWPGGDTFGGSGKFLNGAIYWSVTYFDGPVKWGIVSHDLATDTFTVLPLPDFDNDDDDDVRVEVKVLRGCLAVCCERNTHMDIWLMEDCGVRKSWTKVARIPFFLDFRDYEFTRPCPLSLSVDGRMLVNYGTNLSLYDPRYPYIHHFSNRFEVEAITYSESLVSPNLESEVIIGRTLPPEIITEILLRLPVKSLLRFSTVSNEWLSLISSSQFAKAHLKFATKSNVYTHDRLIFGSRTSPMDLYTCSLHCAVKDSVSSGSIYPEIDEHLQVQAVCWDNPNLEPDDVIWLLGSCHGLVCVSLLPNTVMLWNPMTRQSEVLPDSGTDMDFEYSGLTYGFGYDELHDDYKVVEFFSFERVTGSHLLEIQVKVYSLRANSWRVLSNWPGGDTFGGSGKYLNGAIHWSVTHYDGPVEWEIVSHDLAMDTFTVLPLPDHENDDVTIEVKVLNGCLAVCCERNTHMDVWLMKEYRVRESWTKVACIPFFLDLMDNEYIRPCPLFLSPDGRILINYGSNISVYDPRNPHIHHFSDSVEVEGITYSESLISPNLEDTRIRRTLPPEVIMEILLRLPVKSLVRFSSVSKGWFSLISSPQFVKAHLKIQTKSDMLIFGSKTFPMDLYICSLDNAVKDCVSCGSIYPIADENLLVQSVWLDFPYLEADDAIWFLGSCNGLVCVFLTPNTMILWNPAMRKSKVLPYSGTDELGHYSMTYGVGYDELHDDYKVVEIFKVELNMDTYQTKLKVYSLRSNSWKTLSNWPGGDTFRGLGKFLNGVIHWLVHDSKGPSKWALISLDLSSDTFVKLPAPNFEDADEFLRIEVHILQGCLALSYEHDTYMDIWLMHEYGVQASWTKVVRVPFFVNLREHQFIGPTPIFLSEDGKMVIDYGSSLAVYDMRNPEIHHFGCSFKVETTTFIESLVPPDLDGENHMGRALW